MDPTTAPILAASAVEFPPHRHSQDEVISALSSYCGSDFLRFAASSGVEWRHLALPMKAYTKMNGFTDANAAFVEVALAGAGDRATPDNGAMCP